MVRQGPWARTRSRPRGWRCWWTVCAATSADGGCHGSGYPWGEDGLAEGGEPVGGDGEVAITGAGPSVRAICLGPLPPLFQQLINRVHHASMLAAASRTDGDPRPWEDRQVDQKAAEVTALVADEAMAQRLLGWLVPGGDPLVALSAAEVERFCWYELPRKWDANACE